MKTDMLIAGHGGQGIMELGNFIAYNAVLSGKHVAYTPSYGPETRGGKAKCFVVVSDGEIDSPIAEEPDILIVMNIPSLDFVPLLKKNGLLVMNSSLIDRKPQRKDINAVGIPITETSESIKAGLRDPKMLSNSVAFGGLIALTEKSFDEQRVRKIYEHFLIGSKSQFIDVNVEAAKKGFEIAR